MYRNRKKLEKALAQAKEDMQVMSDKLSTIQRGKCQESCSFDVSGLNRQVHMLSLVCVNRSGRERREGPVSVQAGGDENYGGAKIQSSG